MERHLLIAICLPFVTGALGAQSLLELQARPDLGPLDSPMFRTSVHDLDFDGDGILDLLFGAELGYTVDSSPLLRGLGDGSFVPVAAFGSFVREHVFQVGDFDGDGIFEFTTQSGIWSIAADGTRSLRVPGDQSLTRFGDLDQDGDLDAVRSLGGSLHVLMQTAPLQFTNTQSLPMPGVTTDIGLGDADGDGSIDVLVTIRNAPVRLFENAGTGQLVDVSQRLQAATGDRARCRIHDLDGDGRGDVVLLATDGQGGIQVLLERSGSYLDVSQQVALPAGEHVDLACADVDGDGQQDITVANRSGGTMLRGTASGWFLPLPSNWPGPGDHGCIALLDVDRDGDLDLVEGGDLLHDRVHYNDGRGHFAGPGHDRQVFPWGGRADERYVVPADLDRDGDLDLVGPSRTWWNDGFGRFTSAPGSAPANPSGLPEAVAIGRVDADLFVDLVVPTAFDRFRVFHGDGRGGFQAGTEYQAPIAGQGGPPPLAPQHIAVLALHDLDQDGDLDVVCGAHPRVWTTGSAPAFDTIWWNDGTGQLTEDRQWCVTGAQFGKAIAFGDLNGDGRTDFTDGMDSFLQRPDGRFDHVAPDPTGWLYTGTLGPVALADLDADGDLDVVEANACAGRPFCEGEPDVIGWNDGNGRFLRESLVEEQDSRGLALFDADADGDIDIYFGRYQSGIHRQGYNVLLLNEGNRQFRPATLGDQIPEVWRTTWQVLQGDFDGDGDTDLFTLGEGEQSVAPFGTLWLGMARQLLAPRLLRLGRTYRLELHGVETGGALYGAPLTAHLPLPPVGTIGLDPGTTAVFATFGAPTHGRAAILELPVPVEPVLAGLSYAFQGLVLDASGTARLTPRALDSFLAH